MFFRCAPFWRKNREVYPFLAKPLSNMYIIPAAHEALIHVFSTARPQKDTLELIEPKVATTDTIKGIPHDEVWQSLIVAKTVTNWCVKTNSALVQVCNPSDRGITLQPKTIACIISPVTAIPENTTSAVANNHLESSQARIDLVAALDESFKRSTLNDHQ